MRRAALLPSFTSKSYMLFSKSGFTDALERRAAQQGGISLVGVDDMFAVV
jgi:hypothetical protein